MEFACSTRRCTLRDLICVNLKESGCDPCFELGLLVEVLDEEFTDLADADIDAVLNRDIDLRVSEMPSESRETVERLLDRLET